MAGLITINVKVQTGIHINIQDAYRESRNLRRKSEELDAHCEDLRREADELMSVWRGSSATRVEQAILRRSDQASKLSDNLGILSTALYETARTYEDAAKASGRGSSGGGGGGGGGGGW